MNSGSYNIIEMIDFACPEVLDQLLHRYNMYAVKNDAMDCKLNLTMLSPSLFILRFK